MKFLLKILSVTFIAQSAFAADNTINFDIIDGALNKGTYSGMTTDGLACGVIVKKLQLSDEAEFIQVISYAGEGTIFYKQVDMTVLKEVEDEINYFAVPYAQPFTFVQGSKVLTPLFHGVKVDTLAIYLNQISLTNSWGSPRIPAQTVSCAITSFSGD